MIQKEKKNIMNNQSSIMWTQLIHYLFMLTHTPVSSFTSLRTPMFISSSYMYQDLVNYSETRWQEISMNTTTTTTKPFSPKQVGVG
jgi:hypothetical protein